MPARTTEVRDAVVTAVNSQSWPFSAMAEARQFQRHERERSTSPAMYFSAGEQSHEKIGRAGIWQTTRAVQMLVRGPVGDSNAALDGMIELTEQLTEYVRNQRAAGHVCVEVTQEEPFDLDSLHSQKLFDSLTTFAFREVRS